MLIESILLFSMQVAASAGGDEVQSKVQSSEAVIAVFAQREELGPQKLVLQLEKLGEDGDMFAYALLGEMFSGEMGGVKRNDKRGCNYSEKAGALGSALHNVATCYYFGAGRELDQAKARVIYAQAAQAGFMQSNCALGNMLVKGEGGPVDAEEGLRLCRKGAAAGDANALTDLGGYLLRGVGTARDPESARFMLEEAANLGQPNAAFLTAQIYAKGDGVAKSPAIAKKWFETAYQAGRSDAAFQLAMILMQQGYKQEGEVMSVSPDALREAVKWLGIAQNVDPNPANRQKAEELIPVAEKLIGLVSQE